MEEVDATEPRPRDRRRPFIQVAELVVNGWEVAVGILPSSAAGGLAIHLALAIVFGLGLRRA